MSHVTTCEVAIDSLDMLATACKQVGLELVKNQTKYKWYGTHVGDYPVPKGFAISDMGKCEHAIRIPGNSEAYEIGVVKRRDGKPGYTLIYDFFAGGHGLEAVAGKGCGLLAQAYSEKKFVKNALMHGFKIVGKKNVKGKIVYRVSK